MLTPIADLQQEKRDFFHARIGQDQREKFRLGRQFWQLHLADMRALEDAFGELNGWRRSGRTFTPEALGRKKRSWDHNNPDLGTGWMDHAIYYRVRRMNVAIVGQPYGGVEGHRAALGACAREHGLRWHVPPMPYASFWYPGSCIFVVMTLPEVGTVRWLPEQISDPRFL